jgi:hypothetical protein
MTRLWAALLCGAALSFGYLSDPSVVKWIALYGVVLALFLVYRPLPDAGVLIFVLWIALSLTWSPDWREGILRLQNIAALATIVLCARHINAGWFAAFGIVGAVLLTLWKPELIGGFGNENWRTDFVAICLPLTLYLGWRGLPFLALGAAFIGFAGSLSALAAFGAAAGVLALCAWRVGLRYPLILLVVLGINVAVLVFDWNNPTFWQRAELYHNTLRIWADHPFFGTGIGSWEYVYPLYQETHLWFTDRTMFLSLVDGAGPTMVSGAAHSDVLQLLADYGLLGLLIVYSVLRRVNWLTPGGLAVASAIGAASVGFTMQTPAAAIAACVALGAALGPSPSWRSLFQVGSGSMPSGISAWFARMRRPTL